MTKRLSIDARQSEETRVVLLSGTRIEDFDYETDNRKQLKGNVYLARYPREIDIAPELFAVVGFVIEILNTGAAQQDNPCFFGLTGVDQ